MHVYASIPQHIMKSPAITSLHGALKAGCPQYQALALDECHLSLSRPGSIAGSQLASLQEELRGRVRGCAPFSLRLDRLSLLVNEAGTQCFVAAEAIGARLASDDGQAYRRLLRTVDGALARHGLARYYEEPRPHVSLGWAPLRAQSALAGVLARQHDTLAPGLHVEARWKGGDMSPAFACLRVIHSISCPRLAF